MTTGTTAALRRIGMAGALALVVAACGGGEGAGGGGGEGDGVRVIEVRATDELRFEPDRVTVTAGEPVRFVVTNAGELPHEFVLGDEDRQAEAEAEHESEGEGEHGHAELPSVELGPGETEEVEVTFEEPGEILYGCHEPGHYAAGMVGTIVVEAA